MTLWKKRPPKDPDGAKPITEAMVKRLEARQAEIDKRLQALKAMQTIQSRRTM